MHHWASPSNPVKRWKPVHLKMTLGLPVWATEAVGINFNGLVELLSLPRQLRAQNAYTSKNVIIVDSLLVAIPPIERNFSDGADLDWARVAAANYSLAVQWRPTPKKQDWLNNFLKNSLTIAAGFIPGIGPLAAIAFPVAWTAISDSDSSVDTTRNIMPGYCGLCG
ncbi:hypothetical protein BKA67DRAFT_690750 [Truncatella angustata]|uniref:Uncharacterized protein n=1 Tax=Truncatella angustata TaxID=152316 RepID=A0A9P8ZYH9_9PEZI|nr:uncharacterized protein BKA67DRAFT_690750 [Truncatella angustata]KAH6656061.1 hypothetical protein BKA67DRAFT_690750 [Truncatella angustata]